MKWKLQVSERTVKFAMMANVPPAYVEGNARDLLKREYSTKREAQREANWVNMWSAYQQGKMGKKPTGCAAKAVKVEAGA